MFCPNCKKEIPEGTKFCPGCGADTTAPVQAVKKAKKPVTKKWWFWVIISILLIGLIASIGGGNDSTADSGEITTQSQNAADETTTAAETTTSDNRYSVGETIEDGKLAITYASAEEWKDYDTYSAPDSGNKVIRLKFEFTNKGDTDAWINSFYCYADDQSAEEYYSGDDRLSTYTLSAGRATSGYIYFEVPEDAEVIEVEYEVNAWSDEKAVFVVEL